MSASLHECLSVYYELPPSLDGGAGATSEGFSRTIVGIISCSAKADLVEASNLRLKTEAIHEEGSNS